MVKTFEIKRKVFEVIEDIDENTFKVNRHGKEYLLRDLSNNKKEFDSIVKVESKLNMSGIRTPKLYYYDKNSGLIVSEVVEGIKIFDLLQQKDLEDSIYEQIFRINYFCKRNNLTLSFNPEDYLWSNETLYYVGKEVETYDPRKSFEKKAIELWFYTDVFKDYLISKGIPFSGNHKQLNKAEMNKEITLTVCKYYM